ncbi:MAG: RbsD/FucU domain-containing protein [Bacteroidota bacterium]
MLKNIPKIISPELLKILDEMGHGDEIVIADGNFPTVANAQRLVRLDGHNVPEILKAVLKLFPLDASVKSPVGLMEVAPGDDVIPNIWEDFRRILNESDEAFEEFEFIERFEFYERAKKAFAIVATSELVLYANIILKKGVITI